MPIRSATPLDASAISELVLEASESVRAQDFSEQGWQFLKKTTSVKAVSERLVSEEYFALICELQGVAAGYISMLNFEKIEHLFVLPRFRNIGVASHLWSRAQDVCIRSGNTSYFWVRSSSYAVPVYESFGFRISGDKKESNGISFQFMEKGERRDTSLSGGVVKLSE